MCWSRTDHVTSGSGQPLRVELLGADHDLGVAFRVEVPLRVAEVPIFIPLRLELGEHALAAVPRRVDALARAARVEARVLEAGAVDAEGLPILDFAHAARKQPYLSAAARLAGGSTSSRYSTTCGSTSEPWGARNIPHSRPPCAPTPAR